MVVQIFISYRRDDCATFADRIHECLVRSCKRDTFFRDIDSIHLGENFRRRLHQELARCDLLLAIVGQRWISVQDSGGRRRLEDDNDFVRLEIEMAIQRNIPLIPLLIDGTPMPTTSELPASIAEFTYQNAAVVRRDPDFANDMRRLVMSLDQYRAPSGTSDQPFDDLPFGSLGM